MSCSEVGYIPLEFDAGDALQFDWSHEKAILGELNDLCGALPPVLQP